MQQRDKDSLWEQDRNSLVFAAASLKKTDSLTEKMVRRSPDCLVWSFYFPLLPLQMALKYRYCPKICKIYF
jgi:hypothetical protein